MSTRLFNQLNRFDDFKSADYNAAPAQNAQSASGSKRFKDINWLEYDGVQKSGNLHSLTIHAKPAVAHGTLKENRTIWSWENPEDLWLCNMKTETDAKLIIPTGVFHFQFDGSINPKSIDPEAYTAS